MNSKLVEMQSRFQKKQMQEKEEKLLKLYENQKNNYGGRGSAGSNTSTGSTTSGGGKVRQLFEERRKAGIDKSYPLEPINSTKLTTKRPINTKNITQSSTTTQKSVLHIKNGKPLINKRETTFKVYNNNNGIEKYKEDHYLDNNLINMLEKNNIYDNNNIENEESPLLENSDDIFIGKLSNVGGKPPSQNFIKQVPKNDHKIKPIQKKSPVKKPVQNTLRSGSSNTPLISTTNKMAYATRTPNSNRPSESQMAPSQRIQSPVVRDDLQECSCCNRRFAIDRIKKHEEICGKTNKKQRRTYDAFKHRVQGTEIEQFSTAGKRKGSKSVSITSKKQSTLPSGRSKKNWRKTHEEFIATIRAAKIAQAHVAGGGKLSDLPPPPPSSNPDYVQCPSCGRRFNEAAAQRHIPKCATYEYNKPKPGATRKR